MYCPNCGTYNEDSYNNCISCGKYIADINKKLRPAASSVSENEAKNESAVIPESVTDTKNVYYSAQEMSDTVTQSEDTAYVKDTSESFYDTEERKQTEEKKHTPDRQYYETIYRQYVKKPKEYFILSILCTIFGSIGFGIAAIVFSVMTKAEVSAGNIKKASIYSQNTRTFCIFSIVIGVIKYLFIIIMISSYFVPTVNYYRTPFMW